MYRAFHKQAQFHQSDARVRGAFAGKRGGKTEAGAVESIKYSIQMPEWNNNGIDPYMGCVIAPTNDMLRRLSLAKFEAYAKDLIISHNKTYNEYTLQNGSKVVGISGDRPARLEGLKLNWIWIDEVFQVSEQLFLECMARVADSKGHIWVTGSLGVQYINPKSHFIHRYFKDKPLTGSKYFEWATSENPYFPQEELERLRHTLDPTSYRQMFEICWDVLSTSRVYDDFTEDNILDEYTYDPNKPTYVSIDWGWAHPMAVGFFQLDGDRVVLFDEIVASKIKLPELYQQIMSKGYNINNWVCDISGQQERESHISNIDWFKQKGIHFKYSSSQILYGISLLRSFIKNTQGVRKFYVVRKCEKCVDGMLNYSYQEKNGEILNENPLKKDDDAVDMIRYFFVNIMDPRRNRSSWNEYNRWSWKHATRI